MAYDISSPFDPGRRGARFVAADGPGGRVGARRQRGQPRLPLVLDAGAALISGEPDYAFEPFARADPAVPVAAAAELLRRPHGRDRRVRARRAPGLDAVRRDGGRLRRRYRPPRTPADRRRHLFLFRLLRGRQATQPEPAYAGA